MTTETIPLTQGEGAGASGCFGKRHYPSKARALRGAKTLRSAHRDEKARAGELGVYRCDCGQWCAGHGYSGKPQHKRDPRKDRNDFGKGAELWAQANAIAAAKYPNGANATQLGDILRSVLRSDSDSRRMAETGTGSVRSTASAGRQASPQPEIATALKGERA